MLHHFSSPRQTLKNLWKKTSQVAIHMSFVLQSLLPTDSPWVKNKISEKKLVKCEERRGKSEELKLREGKNGKLLIKKRRKHSKMSSSYFTACRASSCRRGFVNNTKKNEPVSITKQSRTSSLSRHIRDDECKKRFLQACATNEKIIRIRQNLCHMREDYEDLMARKQVNVIKLFSWINARTCDIWIEFKTQHIKREEKSCGNQCINLIVPALLLHHHRKRTRAMYMWKRGEKIIVIVGTE